MMKELFSPPDSHLKENNFIVAYLFVTITDSTGLPLVRIGFKKNSTPIDKDLPL